MTGSGMLHIRKAKPRDAGAIAAIILPTIRAGETYTLDPDMSEAASLACWMAPDKETFAAEADGVVLDTYYVRANQAGGGCHVCNCGGGARISTPTAMAAMSSTAPSHPTISAAIPMALILMAPWHTPSQERFSPPSLSRARP